MQNETQVLSEERAAAVWQRAAELQAEAAKRSEAAAPPLQLLAAAEGSSDADAGFRVADVRAAAAQAGIPAEFVTLALAESEGVDARGFSGAAGERVARRLLGTRQRSIEVARAIPGEPAAVVASMQRVLSAPPYLLALSGTVGPDPLSGGVLIFDLPPYHGVSTAPFAYNAAIVGVKQLRLMLRPVATPGAAPVTEVSITIDLRRSVLYGSLLTGAMGGLGAALGGVGGAALGAGALALGALAALPAVAGVALVGAPFALGCGAAYRYYIRKLTADLEAILRSMEAQVRTAGVFAPPGHGDTPGYGGTFRLLGTPP
ncbi:MAG TPA: hypothetical protein VK420_15930 [Longimicrobium sp.]|nr:hypothetical protein [Longimicrobium sp.]